MHSHLNGWARTRGVSFALVLVIFSSASLRIAAAVDAADATASTSAAHTLKHVLDGLSAPSGIAELKAMQSHVQKLADHLKKCTVGVQVGPAWGSGVIISKDGYVLTAAHVAGKPNRECTFTLSDGRTEVKGKTLGLFRTLDAGLMKITDSGDYPFAEIGDSSKLREGQWCIAMGHPGGYQSERGTVLRLGQILLADNEAITTYCTLVGGDSGGPLFDMDGHVIGINSRIAERLTTNMHVPVNAYKDRDAWNRMVKGESWGHLPGHAPYLGVGGEDNSKEAKIVSVKPDSPAERSGLKPGDIVIAYDDRPITDFSGLTQAVSESQVNESVVLKVRRNDKQEAIRVRLGRRAE